MQKEEEVTDQIKSLSTKLICTTEEAQKNTKVACRYLLRFNEAQRWHAQRWHTTVFPNHRHPPLKVITAFIMSRARSARCK